MNVDTTQLVIVCTTLLIVVIIAFGRKLTVSFHDVKTTVEKTNTAVGEPNGGGSAMDQLAALDHKIDTVKNQVVAVDDRLDQRTHVIRTGSDKPEDLGEYIRERTHDILEALTLQGLKIDWLWKAAEREGWDIPDLPSMKKSAEVPETNKEDE